MWQVLDGDTVRNEIRLWKLSSIAMLTLRRLGSASLPAPTGMTLKAVTLGHG